MATQASTTNHSTQGPQRTAVTDGERTIGQIVSDATTNAQSLVRDEIALAKAEVTGGLKIGADFLKRLEQPGSRPLAPPARHGWCLGARA